MSKLAGKSQVQEWERELEFGMSRVEAKVEFAVAELEGLRPDVATWRAGLLGVRDIALSKQKHMFRPQLVLLGSAAGRGAKDWRFLEEAPSGVLDFAAGVELQHLFMFVHDDMMDHAHTRRGQDTVQVAIARSERERDGPGGRAGGGGGGGGGASLESVQHLTTLVGDVLHAKSAALMAAGERRCLVDGAPDSLALSRGGYSAMDIVLEGSLRAGAAQFDDILGWAGVERALKQHQAETSDSDSESDSESDADFDTELSKSVSNSKNEGEGEGTGKGKGRDQASSRVLERLLSDKASFHSFVAPLLAGIRLGRLSQSAAATPGASLAEHLHTASHTASGELEVSCAAWGMHAGAAFQGLDDVMDLVLEVKDSGKDRLQDIQEGRLSLPLFLLRRLSSEEEWASVFEILGSPAVMAPADRHLLLKLSHKYELARRALDFVDEQIELARAHVDSAPLRAPGNELTQRGLRVFLSGLVDVAASLRIHTE